jgi:hypothetical protein
MLNQIGAMSEDEFLQMQKKYGNALANPSKQDEAISWSMKSDRKRLVKCIVIFLILI